MCPPDDRLITDQRSAIARSGFLDFRPKLDPGAFNKSSNSGSLWHRELRLAIDLLGTDDRASRDQLHLRGHLIATQPQECASLTDLPASDHVRPTFRRPSPVRMKTRAGGTRRVSVRLMTCRRLSRCAKRDRTSPGRRRQAAWISAAVAWVRSNRKVRIRMSGEVRRVVTRSIWYQGARGASRS